MDSLLGTDTAKTVTGEHCPACIKAKKRPHSPTNADLLLKVKYSPTCFPPPKSSVCLEISFKKWWQEMYSDLNLSLSYIQWSFNLICFCIILHLCLLNSLCFSSTQKPVRHGNAFNEAVLQYLPLLFYQLCCIQKISCSRCHGWGL